MEWMTPFKNSTMSSMQYEGRLRTLSMQRTQRVRADIHKTLSDRSSPLSDTVINAPKRNVTRQPPRTAADCEGGK